MIYVITGKIGGGKTLLALTEALKVLGKGGCVVSNIALNPEEVDKWLKRHKRRRLVEGQMRYHNFEEQPDFHLEIPWGCPELPVTVFVDESQLYYNQADGAAMAKQRRKLLSFLTQSRKACVDVWFITQHETTIWAQFRHQALFGYRCRDMRAVTLPFVGRIGALGLTWTKFDLLSGAIMNRGRTALDERLFRLYDTRQMYDSQMTELQKAAEIWEPVPRSTPGIYETRSDSSGVPRRPGLLRLAGLGLFRQKDRAAR